MQKLLYLVSKTGSPFKLKQEVHLNLKIQIRTKQRMIVRQFLKERKK